MVSADGHLLAAAHCVVDDSDVPAGGTHESETDITVAFRDSGTMHADLIGFDMHADVAVLRLEQHSVLRLWSIPVRRHTYPQPGDVCVIVGNISDQDPRSVAVGTVRNGRWHDPYGRSLLSTVLTDVATPFYTMLRVSVPASSRMTRYYGGKLLYFPRRKSAFIVYDSRLAGALCG